MFKWSTWLSWLPCGFLCCKTKVANISFSKAEYIWCLHLSYLCVFVKNVVHGQFPGFPTSVFQREFNFFFFFFFFFWGGGGGEEVQFIMKYFLILF